MESLELFYCEILEVHGKENYTVVWKSFGIKILFVLQLVELSWL